MKSLKLNFLKTACFLLLTVTFSQCTKFTEPDTLFNNKVSVTTGAVQGTPSSSLTITAGTITCLAVAELASSERGVCFSLSPNSVTVFGGRSSSGSGVGTYNASLTNLIPGSTYYYRSYLIYSNTSEVFYGDIKSFNTPQVTCATVTTSNLVRQSSTAILGGNVTLDGGSAINDRGLLISLSNSNPTLGLSGVFPFPNGQGAGSFSQNLTGFQAGTRYYVRAYAINGVCTSYGNTITFIW